MTSRFRKNFIAAVLAICILGFFSSGYALKILKGSSNQNSASVLEYHNGPKRDGVYIDRTLTKSSARSFHLDTAFKANIKGAVYAQLLYVSKGGGKGVIIAASEDNEVSAFDSVTGKTLWKRDLGTPVHLSDLPCGNIDPLGVTGTPVIDKSSGTIYLDAMTTPDGGHTKKHLVYAISLKDGSVVHGWPVDVSARVKFGKIRFESGLQNQRGALTFFKGTVYVPYGGHYGDCGNYRGWLIGLQASDPSSPKAWATGSYGAGSWAPGGVASDDGKLFISTGNQKGAAKWSGGEAVIRFSPGPVFSGKPADYFTPKNWEELDSGDTDLGSTGPVMINLPGSKPKRSKLVLVLGKDGKIYLLDRNELGGKGGQAAAVEVASNRVIGAAAAYTTAHGTYVVFKGKGIHCPSGQSGDLAAVRLTAGSPPEARIAWCANQHGKGSPMVTTTDGHSEAIVWSVGAEGDNRLHGFDGDTGRVVYAGSGSIGRVRRYQTPVLAGGRIYIAADGVIKAFKR